MKPLNRSDLENLVLSANGNKFPHRVKRVARQEYKVGSLFAFNVAWDRKYVVIAGRQLELHEIPDVLTVWAGYGLRRFVEVDLSLNGVEVTVQYIGKVFADGRYHPSKHPTIKTFKIFTTVDGKDIIPNHDNLKHVVCQ